MARGRHTPEQVVNLLRQVEVDWFRDDLFIAEAPMSFGLLVGDGV